MKLRKCVFTWNNYSKDLTDNREDIEKYFKGLAHLDYYCIGFEICPTTGTPHLQGYLHFTQQKTFDTLKKCLLNSHIEKVMGTNLQAIDYCKKGNDFIEYGEIPAEERQRTDLEEYIQAIEDGADEYQLLKQFPTQYARFDKMINKVKTATQQKEYGNKLWTNIKENVYYIYGSAGSGKTSSIYEMFDYNDICRVTNYEHPFDFYKGGKILVFEEFRSQLKIGDILNYLDARYGDKIACYEVVFIITNIKLESQYPNVMEETAKAFKRRITKIINQDNLNLYCGKLYDLLSPYAKGLVKKYYEIPTF